MVCLMSAIANLFLMIYLFAKKKKKKMIRRIKLDFYMFSPAF